ncbi:MAG TPA: nodulation protein NfeD [Anaerolineaceae bacterium]
MKAFRLASIILVIFYLFSLLPASTSQAQSSSPQVTLLKAEGALTPVMVGYIQRGLANAAARKATLVVLQLNTPGGSTELMNQIIQNIRGSSVPIVVFVAPRGAMAASAGTIITLAGHAAAMAPETAIGAASPVGAQGEDIGSTMESKVKEILKATARSLAEKRGTAAVKMAEQAIDEARAASASEALQAGMIDLIAEDLPDLLVKLDGITIDVQNRPVKLRTAGAVITEEPLTFIEQLLGLLTNPNLVFLLLSIGVQAILIELSSPGGWVAGFIGAVCILLAVYGLGLLPVNWFGILFLILAFILFILDIKAPTHGALTAAGVGSFIVGALVLFNSPGVPSFQRVSVPLVVGMGISTGLIFLGVLTLALRAQRSPIRTGQESLAGRWGTTRSEINPSGTVQVSGELWSADLAEGEPPIPRGSRVKIVGIEGIRLKVKRE